MAHNLGRGPLEMAQAVNPDVMDVDQPIAGDPDRLSEALRLLQGLTFEELETVKLRATRLQNDQSPLFRLLPGELRNAIYIAIVHAHLQPLAQKKDHNWFDIQCLPLFFGTCRQVRKECAKLFPFVPYRILVERDLEFHHPSDLGQEWLSNQVGLSGLVPMESTASFDSINEAKDFAMKHWSVDEGHLRGVIVFEESLSLGPKAWRTHETPKRELMYSG